MMLCDVQCAATCRAGERCLHRGGMESRTAEEGQGRARGKMSMKSKCRCTGRSDVDSLSAARC